MKKICILSAVNIRHMSMISLYTEKLKKDGIDFDIIYMDKYGEEEKFDSREKYVFTNIIKSNTPRLLKVLQYFKFRRYAITILEEKNYDFIIVWNDVAIFIFADYLAKKWKGKYCLNIRDYCGEKNPLIYKRFKHVIDCSAFTTISSNGFKEFLPPFNYLHVHSLNKELLKKINPRKALKNANEPIRISFIGNIRFYETNKRLLEIFKNDSRFQLHYYGTNANILEKYAYENSIKNTVFHDTFPVEDTPKYIEYTDLINNLYGNKSIALDYAVSIKLYYGVYNRSPILVNKGTYGADLINDYGIGFVVNELSTNLPNDIYNWYNDLDFGRFYENCDRLLRKIEEDYKKFETYYGKFIANK